jgi:hypothetical protein
MNCNEVKEKMWDYLSDNNLPHEFEEHLAHCPDCSAEFEQLQHFIQTLKPKIKVRASNNFTNNTIKKLKEDQKMKKRIPFYLKVAVFILLFATSLFLIFNKRSDNQVSATPVNKILTEVIKELQKMKSMRMELEIRTIENDNFELIGTEYGFVKHLIKVEFAVPKKWLIEKPGRTVLCDGKNQYLDIQIMDYVIKGDANADFVNWLHILLSPDIILEIENQRAKKEQTKYELTETETQLMLTVFQKAQGDFTNDYLKNSFVTTSDSKRIFYFDKATHQLLAFELYIIENVREILVMKTTEIKYNETFDSKDFSLKIFDNKAIKTIEKLEPIADKSLMDKTPEEIAFYFFDACAKNDWKKVKKVCTYTSLIKSMYGELEIIEIGKAFQSGVYRGYYVPYTVKLKSGYIKTFNMAVRNDNKQKMWQVDGGI